MPGHPGDQVSNLRLRPFEAGRRGVLGEHALRDVEDHHDVGGDPPGRSVACGPAGLGAHQREHAEHQGEKDESETTQSPGEGRPAAESMLHRRRHEAIEEIPAPDIEEPDRGDDPQSEPEKMNPSRMGKGDQIVHGNLWKSAPRVSHPVAARPSPKARKRA